MNRASVVGLGKLGACMAASLASKNFLVTGVDVSPRTIELVNSGKSPVFEPGLDALMAKHRDRLRATDDYAEAVNDSEVTFVVVPTPSDTHGGFSLKYVKQAMGAIGRALRDKKRYHLVVLTSTVLPGASEHAVLPVLEEAAGKRCGEDFGFCFNPEFIALGSVIRDFLNPDFLLIGEYDARAGNQLASLFESVCENHPPVAHMNLVNAELTKLAVNSYVTMKITFANTLAALCEQLPGADIDVVTSALGHDARIGPRYLKGAIGYGGPCFPRDNVALAYLARQLGQRALLAEATDAYNRGIVDRLVEKILADVPNPGLVAVLGLAYKPDTDVVEESQGLQIAERLASKGIGVVVYDPVAMHSARRVLGHRVSYATSAQDCVHQAALVVIANPDREFVHISPEHFCGRAQPVIVDAWRLLGARFEREEPAKYKAIGLGNDAGHTVPKLKSLWNDAEAQATVEAGAR